LSLLLIKTNYENVCETTSFEFDQVNNSVKFSVNFEKIIKNPWTKWPDKLSAVDIKAIGEYCII